MNRYRKLHLCFLNVLACAILVSTAVTLAAGQGAVTGGGISGVVTDNTGAVVPGASVSVRNPATNFSRQTVTDNGGEFSVTDVPPGIYNVVISHPGFKQAEYPNVQVNVGTNQQIDPPWMSVRPMKLCR